LRITVEINQPNHWVDKYKKVISNSIMFNWVGLKIELDLTLLGQFMSLLKDIYFCAVSSGW